MKTFLKIAGGALLGAVFVVALLIAVAPPRIAYDPRTRAVAVESTGSVSLVGDVHAQVGTLIGTLLQSASFHATPSTSGTQSAADKTKLDALPATFNDLYTCGRWGFTAAPASTSPRWASITWGAILTTQAAGAIHIAPGNLEVVRMTARNMNGLSTDTVTYSLDINAVNNPNLSVTIPAGSTTAVTAVPSSTITVSAGDSLWARVVQSSTTADAAVDARIDILCKSVP